MGDGGAAIRARSGARARTGARAGRGVRAGPAAAAEARAAAAARRGRRLVVVDAADAGAADARRRPPTAGRRALGWWAEGSLLIRRANERPRKRAVGFALDHGLLRWRVPQGRFPTSLADYELYDASVPAHLRALHGAGYKLVVFAEDARIRQSCEGKSAQLRMSLVDWVATEAGVPLHAVVACEKNVPTAGGGGVAAMEEQCNGGVRIAPKRDALFVRHSPTTSSATPTFASQRRWAGARHARQVYVHDW